MADDKSLKPDHTSGFAAIFPLLQNQAGAYQKIQLFNISAAWLNMNDYI